MNETHERGRPAARPEDASALESLRGFFRRHVPAAADMALARDTALLGPGLLDSLAVVELMAFLGAELGLDIGDEDFTPKNLGTVGDLLAFIDGKRAARA